MNGRVYDPLTARFMSADPHVTDPNNGQNYNRYSYVLNDPQGHTDPTGFDLRTIGFVYSYVFANNDEFGGGRADNARATSSMNAAKSAPKSAAIGGGGNNIEPSPAGVAATSIGNVQDTHLVDDVQRVVVTGKKTDSGWGVAVGMTFDWVTGRGSADRYFDATTSSTQNMMSARRVKEARAYFYKKNADALANGTPLAPVTGYKGDFGLTDLFWYAGLNPTQQFVGSYRIDIFPVGVDQIKFELSNNSSMKSFLYGIGPDWERNKFAPFGNMRQVYYWTEEVKR